MPHFLSQILGYTTGKTQPNLPGSFYIICVGYSNCELRLVRERGSNVKGRAEKRGTDMKEGTMGNKERNLRKREAQWNGKKGKEKGKWEKTKREKNRKKRRKRRQEKNEWKKTYLFYN